MTFLVDGVFLGVRKSIALGLAVSLDCIDCGSFTTEYYFLLQFLRCIDMLIINKYCCMA